MKKKQKIKGYIWLCGWKREASQPQVLKAAGRSSCLSKY
jgi:hypothetical protein